MTDKEKFWYDTSLSWKAKGILAFLLSNSFFDKPDGSKNLTVQKLRHFSKGGIATTSSGIKELEELGYLKRVQEKNEKGPFEISQWFVSPDMFFKEQKND